jgi:hypothetical protein
MKKLFMLSVLLLCLNVYLTAQSVGTIYFSTLCDKNAPANTDFKNGDFIFSHVKFTKPLSQVLSLTGKPVTFHIEYSENGKLLEYEDLGMNEADIKSATIAGYVVLPVVSDPDGNCVSYKKNLFATYFPPVLAKLSNGKHTITAKVLSYNYKDAKEVMAEGTFNLTITDPSFYKKNADLAYKAMGARGITYTLEKVYGSSGNTSSGSTGSKKTTVKVTLQCNSMDLRVRLNQGGGTYMNTNIQKNITSTHTLAVGSKIEQLNSSDTRVGDLITITADMDGKTINLCK